MIEYRIEPRFTGNGEDRIYALMRVGVRGGTRLITVYENRDTAYRVMEVLNSARDHERVRNGGK